jgi:hypothetical protein
MILQGDDVVKLSPLMFAGLATAALTLNSNVSDAIEQRVKKCPCISEPTLYVYRMADAQDYVCVPIHSEMTARRENGLAALRRISAQDNRCKPGFVWRDAFDGDGVCVDPPARERVHQENRAHAQRVRPC